MRINLHRPGGPGPRESEVRGGLEKLALQAPPPNSVRRRPRTPNATPSASKQYPPPAGSSGRLTGRPFGDPPAGSCALFYVYIYIYITGNCRLLHAGSVHVIGAHARWWRCTAAVRRPPWVARIRVAEGEALHAQLGHARCGVCSVRWGRWWWWWQGWTRECTVHAMPPSLSLYI